MNIAEIQEQIRQYSQKTEDIFMNLAERFPQLLNKDEGSAMATFLEMFTSLDRMNNENSKNEGDFFTGYDKKYAALFESLNKKIEDLTHVNENVKKITENSEEMELIALNAMVISIKSGERGRAFSSITESLKQLSTDMNIYSNKLLEEEELLLKQISGLKDVFNGIMSAQKKLSSAGTSSSTDVSDLIERASGPLQDIKSIINSVYIPIQRAMEGLQLQDIVRQAMDHILLCFDECSKLEHSDGTNEKSLDNITFNIDLLKLSSSVLDDICKNIKKSIDIFKNNWDSVTSTLNNVEPKRSEYISRFLDRHSASQDNIQLRMEKISEEFTGILEEFGAYQASQKNLDRDCGIITERALQMYAVFEALKPIIARLHHVRILQQIEVAKNPAISAVKDSVIDMDNLISSANESLDQMQDMLSVFITSIKSLLEEFTKNSREDSLEMNKIRIAKNSFVSEFRNVQTELSSMLNSFSVFPQGFEQHCAIVKNKLDELAEIYDSLENLIAQLGDEEVKLNGKKQELMSTLGVDSWELKDDRLKELINHFTIAAHKQEAGQIGNFGVENGAEVGEITFF
ncbi:hypothetical protein [Treponema sp.]|uniref:hypothetical protein n=1 Tax=Treponema sp. TaxID=166 RepID=UPI00298DD3A7|nr:hypothetical protein [Treponema sp.]MCR5613784.1 hypothetical protein [Treponema sp.]